MAIIGRKDDIRELERCERSQKSELICVYGRKRVGKTFLIEQAFANYFAFRATKKRIDRFFITCQNCLLSLETFPAVFFEYKSLALQSS